MVKGENILLGISGGIAAYKAAELCRLFVKENAAVQVIMTTNACKFITPLTLQTLSTNPVYTSVFSEVENFRIKHVSLTDWATVLVVAPATANIIAKMAYGLADDLLSTIFLARGDSPTFLAPAMNFAMYNDSVLQQNLAILRNRGVIIIEPDSGELACGVVGKGRMAEPSTILDLVRLSLKQQKDLVGLRVMITAGPTQEPLDPVRYFSNYSSGKMGYALARAASERGGKVTLISGPTSLTPPAGVDFKEIKTAREMYAIVTSLAAEMDIIIKAAAVADYRPLQIEPHKIKKSFLMEIKLERNPDILKTLGTKKKSGQILVGFAAETQDLLSNAAKKMYEKNLDLIAVNDVSRPEAGFAVDDNAVKLLLPDGFVEDIPLATKDKVANKILDKITEIRRGRR